MCISFSVKATLVALLFSLTCHGISLDTLEKPYIDTISKHKVLDPGLKEAIAQEKCLTKLKNERYNKLNKFKCDYNGSTKMEE